MQASLRTPLRVLHCPENIAGNAGQLARAEREIGIRSRSVSLLPHAFGFTSDEILCPAGSGPLRRYKALTSLLLRALRQYDIVHFNFGRSLFLEDGLYARSRPDGSPLPLARRLAAAVLRTLLDARDLRWLRRAGKGIVVTFQGDDARQGDYSRTHFEISIAQEVDSDYYNTESDAIKRHRIAQFARYAHRIYALNPDLLQVLPAGAEFLPYAHIDLRDWRIPAPSARTVPIVVHAPSHRGAKGTRFIVDAVDRLRAEGVRFEFRLLEGLTHERARNEYEGADLLIDQLLAGWYGGLAVELMALGKPVICYLRRDDFGVLPRSMAGEIPIIEARPDTIYTVLKEWLTARRHELPNHGMRSRLYVERWHDPLKIASRLGAEYQRIAHAVGAR